jgi:trehalose synthase
MSLSEVQVSPESLEPFAALIGPERMERLRQVAARSSRELAGRTIWNVNSTAAGGGVAEMLHVLLGYARGAGVDTRWLVVSGEPDFFRITKRLHNVLHGNPGDGGPLGSDEQAIYRLVLAPQAQELASLVRPGDVVLLHDPQTAGLAEALEGSGAVVLWRCHIGPERYDEESELGVAFLRPHLEHVDGFIFSREAHIHPWIPLEKVTIIPPSIDPFAPKNEDIDPDHVTAIITGIGLVAGDGTGDVVATYRRADGSPARVDRVIELIRGGERPRMDVPIVVQVSRWDRLKDMAGVLRGFAAHVPPPAQLALVGPSVAGVADDPEGAEVLAECAGVWDGLDPDTRARISLVCLPMEDVDENAAMVNAIQRHAAVVVQKSLAEGFGLTVTEAMWKARPVVASGVGGITDQIIDGEQGLLLKDPTDLAALGNALNRLLGDPAEAQRLGKAARARATERFLGDRHLLQYADLFDRLA